MTNRRVRRFISTCPPFFVSRHVAISEAARAYRRSALRLFWKRLAVIAEAPCGYFGSALRLFVLCGGFGGQFIINNDVNVCLIAFV